MFGSLYTRLVNPSVLRSVQSFAVRNYANGRPLIEKGINQVILMGRCGSDAIRRGSEARPVAIFSLATHSHFKNQETSDIQQKTEWHRIVVFKPQLLERTINFGKKGSRLLVQGKLNYGEVTDANGVTHQTTSIVADDIIFLATSRASNEAEVETDDEVAV